MRFQVQRFISQKNFVFICQNRAFLRRSQTHEKTHEKKNPDHIFFLCAYAFSSEKIHLSQNLNSSLRKTLILFVKTVRFCAAHKRMKRHMRKKIQITSFFCAPLRFQVQRFISLKT